MSFAKLLTELDEFTADREALAKSMPADAPEPDGDEGAGEGEMGEEGGEDDATIAAAAEEGEAGEGEPDGDEEGEPMGKSFSFVDENGEEREAVDATDMLKSLQTRVTGIETESGEVLGKMLGLMKSMQTEIGTLRKSLAAMGPTRSGRKTTLSIMEKPADNATELAKSQTPEGLTGREFMAKCEAAFHKGRLTSAQVAQAESYLNRGVTPPQQIVNAALAV